MLQWYVNYLKEKPGTSVWKQHHHHMCAEALNARFGIGATTQQVDRHFRAIKEKWNWIKQAMDKSGYGFDAGSCKFNIHYSERSPSKLGPAKFNYLTRPIKFFHLMEEVFGESAKANGSLAVDQYTADAEDDNNELESDEAYTPEHLDNDSDIITPRCPQPAGYSFSMKRKNKKSPGKKHVKDKAKRARATGDDEIAASLAMLAKSIASSCAATTDPYADLWKRIEDIPFPPRDKVDIATYLSKPEQVHLRNYLNGASDQSFGTWVTDYLAAKYHVTGVDDSEYGGSM